MAQGFVRGPNRRRSRPGATKEEHALKKLRRIADERPGERIAYADLMREMPDIGRTELGRAAQQLTFEGRLKRINPTPAVWKILDPTQEKRAADRRG